jgi:hypothetical protein
MSRSAPNLTGAARSLRGGGPHHDDDTPLISLSDVTEIELLILKRIRDVTIGDHRSLAHGSGFDFVGLREWQAGDRFAAIDWAQSTLTNFSPMIVREFEQPSTATVMVVARAGCPPRATAPNVSVVGAMRTSVRPYAEIVR